MQADNMLVAKYAHELTETVVAASVKRYPEEIRLLFDFGVTGHVVANDPALPCAD